jgi:hypothetical protein
LFVIPNPFARFVANGVRDLLFIVHRVFPFSRATGHRPRITMVCFNPSFRALHPRDVFAFPSQL